VAAQIIRQITAKTQNKSAVAPRFLITLSCSKYKDITIRINAIDIHAPVAIKK
jgi:hypothetical protein